MTTNDTRKVVLKSSLKKPQDNTPVPVEVTNLHEVSSGKMSDASGQTESRKVQWTDACGSELVQIREFELSEVDGTDDEFDNGNDRSCSCAIM